MNNDNWGDRPVIVDLVTLNHPDHPVNPEEAAMTVDVPAPTEKVETSVNS